MTAELIERQQLRESTATGKDWRAFLLGFCSRAFLLGSCSKRLTWRERSSDQHPGSFECRSGFPTTATEPCAAVVKSAFHSSARLSVSAATSCLDNVLTCSIVAIGRALLTAPAALAEPGAPHSPKPM